MRERSDEAVYRLLDFSFVRPEDEVVPVLNPYDDGLRIALTEGICLIRRFNPILVLCCF